MKILVYILCTFPLALLSQNTAPAGYLVNAVDIDKPESYITFADNTTAVNTDINWDIAFYNNAYEIGGKNNEIAKTRIWRVYKDTSAFATITANDTANVAYNSNLFYYYGAMDTVYTGSLTNYFNIGLGKYYSDHNAIGDRVYIIKKSDGTLGKFFLISYLASGRVFTIKYSNIDNTDVKYIQIPKIYPQVKDYRYLNLTTGAINDNIEPKAYNAWDLKITQGLVNINGVVSYTKGLIYTNNKYNMVKYSMIPNLPSFYTQPVVSTQAYLASGQVDTVKYNQSLSVSYPLTLAPAQIGTSWYEGSTTNCKSNNSYFVKTNDNSIYHLIFTSLSDNTLNYAFKKIGSYSSILNSVSQGNLDCQLIDNQLVINSKKREPIDISLYNIEGKTLLNINIIQKGTIDLKDFPKGMIFVKMNTKDETKSMKIHRMD